MSKGAVIPHKDKEIAILGDTQVFIKRSDKGVMKAFRGKVKLEEEKGHIAVIQEKATTTFAGYAEMNKIAGVSIITPDTLTLPTGEVVVNPYPIIDPESGTIEKVWVKKMAVGYSLTGNLTVTFSTLLYDVKMYLLQDLSKKINYNKGMGKYCMEEMLTEAEKKEGMFFKIQGLMGIWVNLENKETTKAIETYIQNKLFAERKATTICERNALKKHPALGNSILSATGPKGKGIAEVNIMGWTHDLSKKDLLEISKKAEKNEELEVEGKKVNIIGANDIDNIDDEDIKASRDEEEIVNEEFEDGEIFEESEEQEVAIINGNKLEELITKINDAVFIVGEEAVNKLLKENFNADDLKSLKEGQLEMLLVLINNLADSGEGRF